MSREECGSGGGWCGDAALTGRGCELVQGGTVPGGESGVFHDCDIPVSVRRDVR